MAKNSAGFYIINPARFAAPKKANSGQNGQDQPSEQGQDALNEPRGDDSLGKLGKGPERKNSGETAKETSPEQHGDGMIKKLLTGHNNECSLASRGASSKGVCASSESINHAKKVLGKSGKSGASGSNNNDDGEFIEEAKKKLSCSSEACVLEKVNTKEPHPEVEKDIKASYKLKGPQDTFWLSNFDIDGILEQWAVRFPKMKHVGFAMCDFDKMGHSLSKPETIIGAKSAGYETVACVVNTDKSRGNGEHWMAIFADFRGSEPTLELFDSIGKAEDKCGNKFAQWVKETAKKAGARPIIISRLEHQRSKSECGVYSLLYIWLRQHELPPEFFQEKYISDYMCFHFRQLLFDGDKKFIKGAKFDLAQYMKECDVKWEKHMKPYNPQVYGDGRGKSGGGIFGSARQTKKAAKAKTSAANVGARKTAPKKANDNYIIDLFGNEDHIKLLDKCTSAPFSLNLPEDISLLKPGFSLAKKLFLQDEFRSNLLADIYFISLYGHKCGSRVIIMDKYWPYAKVLAQFFSDFNFHIYDENVKDEPDVDNIKIFDQSIESAKGGYRRADSPLYICTDTFNPKGKELMDHYLVNKRNIAEELQAAYSSLNLYMLDLPMYDYCQGNLAIMPWINTGHVKAKLFSSIDQVGQLTSYNFDKMGKEIFVHNYFRRFWARYGTRLMPGNSCECWDCCAEKYILGKFTQYLEGKMAQGEAQKSPDYAKELGEMAQGEKGQKIADLILYIDSRLGLNHNLARPPHGIYRNLSAQDAFKKLIDNFNEFL